MVQLKLYELLMCESLMCPPIDVQCCLMGKVSYPRILSDHCLVLAMEAARLSGPLVPVVLGIAALCALS